MNIYVSHLSWGTSSEGLGNLFMQFGEVASANVITDRETGRSRGFGFVEMPNEEEGQKAIDQLNGTSFEGQTITVNVARPPAGRASGGAGGERRGQGGDEMESRPVRLGWLSLLLTVIILCLATLSVLSFSTARADLALAQKQARQAQSVYALECAGQQWLAELDAALAQAGDTAELDALLPHGTAREGPGVSAVLEGADGRSLSVFAELTADGGYRVIQWQQSAEWAGEAEAPALFGTLREG